MNSCVSLCALFLVCVVALEARLFRYEDVLVDPSQDRDQLLAGDWGYGRTEKRSRMCLINAGLSQGCDLSDILMAKQQ
ncbi:unnamed protein product, partial [Nippostrongylus brasiliensis]